MITQADVETDTQFIYGHLKKEDCCHIVDQKKWNITQAMIDGTEIEAMCGYRWIPYRNPDGLPLCTPCVEEFNDLGGEHSVAP